VTSDSKRKPSVLHLGFEVAILLKGVHASLEIVGGVLLWFVKPETLNAWIQALTQNELAENPSDLIANLLVRAGQNYTVNSQHFGVFYLLSHGVVKVVLVLLLWRRRLWAYPLAVAVLALFITYQIFRWTSTHSLFLILLSTLDGVIIWLTLAEYGRLRQEGSSKVEPLA
jgi:uncharacterized membrane protein